jgi:CBS domain-containing protein
MNVEQLMQRTVHTCRAHHTLNDAARLMWEHDCGCLPVVDGEGHAIGMLTDRDICMAAYTRGEALWQIPVAAAMAMNPRTCRTGDTLTHAESVMRDGQLRRLPVVDRRNRVVGILSLNDVARQAAREAHRPNRNVLPDEVASTLGAICTPRPCRDLMVSL